MSRDVSPKRGSKIERCTFFARASPMKLTELVIFTNDGASKYHVWVGSPPWLEPVSPTQCCSGLYGVPKIVETDRRLRDAEL